MIPGLSFFGNILNKKKPPQKKEYRDYEPIAGNNIYDNQTYDKMTKRHIPPYYNSNRSFVRKNPQINTGLSDAKYNNYESVDEKLCDDGTVRMNNNKSCFYQTPKMMNKKNNIPEKNGFLEQFNPLTLDNPEEPSASNSVANILGDVNNNRRNELERKQALNNNFSKFSVDEDQTYGVVSKENFVHGNMMPFFKSSDGGFNPYTERKNTEQRQRKMDFFTGSANNLQYKPKTERKQLFDPVIGLTNLYGTPDMTNFLDSRYIPSNERRNERPTQLTYITPGLNLGYNETGKSGFHDSFRVMPKTVDELRVANNPKLSYNQPVIPGMKGQRGSVPSKMYKRRPLTYWETTPVDYIRGKSYITAATVHAPVDAGNLATVNRGMYNNGRLGGPKLFTDLPTHESLIAKSKVSLKENFANDIAHGVQKLEGKESRGIDESYNPKNTLRGQNQIYNGTAGNANVQNKHIAFDSVNAVPDTNMRNMHDRLNRNGAMGNTQIDKGYTYESSGWIPDANMRNMHDRLNRNGTMGNTQIDKGYTYESTGWVPDANMRNVHDRLNRNGAMGNGELDKPYIFDSVNWVPDANMRNVHDRLNRNGAMGNGELDKPYIFDSINWVPDANMRNVHDRFNRNQIAAPADREKQRSRGDVDNMRLNTIKEVIAQGRKPTDSNYSKGPTVEFTMMNLKEPLNYNREIYPDIQQTTTEKFGFISTRSKQTLPQQSYHFYTYVDDNLKENPLINNVIHQTSDYVK